MASEKQRKGDNNFIKDLKLYQESFSIKVLILKVSLEQFSSSKGSGQVQKIILIDEEGSKIQATLFNATIKTFQEYIHINNTIIIKNGIVRPTNRKYASVNPYFELAFGKNTKITVSKNEINIGALPFSFKSFGEVTKINDENIFFDVLGFITSVRPLYTTDTSVRREVTIMNEEMDPFVLTLWGEHAEKEGQILEDKKKEKAVIAIINVTANRYMGVMQLSSKPATIFLLDPDITEAHALKEWINGTGKDYEKLMRQTPSKLMRRSKKVMLGDIITSSTATKKNIYCYFNAEISTIINPESPCYTACKNCQRKVFVEDSRASCNTCKNADAEWEIKYLMRLEVKDHIDNAYVTLFDEAQFLTDCSPEEYVDSFDEEGKEHLSPMYQKMMNSCGKEYLFLVKMCKKDEEKRIEGRITAQEICKPEDFKQIECDEDEDLKDISLKRKSMASLKKDMNKRKDMKNKNIKIESEQL